MLNPVVALRWSFEEYSTGEVDLYIRGTYLQFTALDFI